MLHSRLDLRQSREDPFCDTVLVPSALAIYAVEVTQLPLGRKQIDSERRTEPATEYRAENYVVKMQHHTNLTDLLAEVTNPSPSISLILTTPGFFPADRLPKVSSFDRNEAPLRQAHVRISDIGTSGKFA